ncbi:hypothetical protein [Clostridium thermobutyricum]|nr:hypothetical protein [Clostridium thermobutyricum]
MRIKLKRNTIIVIVVVIFIVLTSMKFKYYYPNFSVKNNSNFEIFKI